MLAAVTLLGDVEDVCVLVPRADGGRNSHQLQILYAYTTCT